MPKLQQHHVNLLLDLVRSETSDVEGGETFYPDNDDILHTLAEVQEILLHLDLS